MSYNLPDDKGHFDQYGGVFVAETLMTAVTELKDAYEKFKDDPEFLKDFEDDLKHYVGRETPLYHAKNLSKKVGGAQIYLKREDLNHTGAHKINNTIGQALLAQRMGKTRIIAETGAGQHGVASATIAARLGLECVVYMGEVDVVRQAQNVYRMELLGAKVVPVSSGSKTLKDALNEAMRDWVTNIDDTYYIIGTVAGPHPYPMMVRDFQSVIGKEAKEQFNEQVGGLPDAIIACVGGGSNAIGLFHPFIEDTSVQIIGVEAGGRGIDLGPDLMENEDGQIIEGHSISAGLDYPGVGPEHAYLKDIGRAEYVAITDKEALDAFHLLTEVEGIIPALEPSHAIAYAVKLAKQWSGDKSIIINLSGRGDKDMQTIREVEGLES